MLNFEEKGKSGENKDLSRGDQESNRQRFSEKNKKKKKKEGFAKRLEVRRDGTNQV